MVVGIESNCRICHYRCQGTSKLFDQSVGAMQPWDHAYLDPALAFVDLEHVDGLLVGTRYQWGPHP
jgi:hypothetical protein